MVTTKPAYSESKSAMVIAFLVLLTCWSLFYLDHETRTFADLLKPGNLVALAVYFFPTFFISLFLHLKFRNKKSQKTSLFLAFAIGIPVSFALIIGCFLIFR